MWRALEQVGGEGWWVSRPYDDQLIGVDAMDHSKIIAVYVVAQLYGHDRKHVELEALMNKVLEQCDDHERDCAEVKMATLHITMTCLHRQGRYQEVKDTERRLGDLIGPGVQLQTPDEGAGIVQRSTTLRTYGICATAAGRHKDAEEWFRKALKAQEGSDVAGNYDIGSSLFLLGLCVWDGGRPGEAGELFKAALQIEEAMLGPDDVQVAATLHNMGVCAREAGRLADAEESFKRALNIKEAKLGPDNVQVALTLHEMGVCVLAAARPREAKDLFRRALKIREAKLGADDVRVAPSYQMGPDPYLGAGGEANSCLCRRL